MKTLDLLKFFRDQFILFVKSGQRKGKMGIQLSKAHMFYLKHTTFIKMNEVQLLDTRKEIFQINEGDSTNISCYPPFVDTYRNHGSIFFCFFLFVTVTIDGSKIT